MNRALFALLLAGCASNSTAKVREQLQHLTDKQQQSFDSPADPLALSPTPENGPFATDSRKDCSSCPPR